MVEKMTIHKEKIIKIDEKFKEQLIKSEIMKIALVVDDEPIASLMNQLLTVTKLCYFEECDKNIRQILAVYGYGNK